ncbi:MAG: GAF domain-containing protein [Deltaproteobacteria bacterium]|nr:GAF domain-containing protein [Deltaproteobacteria bacterium]
MEPSPDTTRLEAELRRKQHVIDSMREIGRALSSTLSTNTLLALIMDRTISLMDADRSTLFVVDHAKKELWSLIAQGENVKEIRLPIGKGIAGYVAATGETINIPDAYQDARFNPEVDRQTGYRTRNILCMPLRDHNENVMAVLQVLNKRTGPFTREDEELLDALGFQASISLQNSRLYADLEVRNAELRQTHAGLQQKMAELDMLFELERMISSAASLETLLDSVMERTTRFVGGQAGSILLIEEDTNNLFFKTALGDKAAEVKKFKVPVGEGIAGWVAKNGEPLLVSDAYLDDRFRRDIADAIGFPTHSIICVPLKAEGRTIGALEIINKNTDVSAGGTRAFDKEDVKLLTLISGQVAKAIHLTQLREREAKSQRLATVGRAVSGLIHDMQTPMTSIVGFVELMALQDTSDKDREEFAGIVRREVERLTQMIRAQLDFVKGKSDVLLKRVGLGTLINEIVYFLEKEFGEAGIRIETDLAYKGNIHIDESKIKRAIFNLAKNAKEAMPGGGKFMIRSRDDGSHIIIEFADTGSGIPADIRDKVFGEFVTHGKEHGTGLGLAQVKRTIDEHKGEIGFSSEMGKGTTFTIRLPKG